MSLPQHYLRVGSVDRQLDPGKLDPERDRRDIEPWLSAVFQSEHLSLLTGSGLSLAVAHAASAPVTDMALPTFEAPEEEKVRKRAEFLAQRSGRGQANFEDAIRAALQLLDGLETLEDKKADLWRPGIDRVLRRFAESILKMEQGVAAALEAQPELNRLPSFLLSFASRASSRDRLGLFTTNYDRFIESACDAAGIRCIDRFVGTLSPVFRASRLDVDMHYNPPGIRGEPRYVEGVVRLTKLHGSIDWRFDGGQIRRCALPFGAAGFEPGMDALRSLMIFPNPAKDVETAEYPYAELFRDFSAAICRPNSALVTYGYGFGDDHVNRVLRDMLTIPSTHLVVIAYGDPGDRLERFLSESGRPSQISLLVGPHLAGLENLVGYFLPKPAMDAVTIRQAELTRRRDIAVRADLPAGGSEDVNPD